MSIKNKCRKELWGKSGNKCAICKKELFPEREKKLNIGEECHIISSKAQGPRYKPDLDDYDDYDNLILLCRNHHREIDELSETYTEEILRYIKTLHENWVNSSLNDAISLSKKQKPKFLYRITSGKELLSILSNCHGSRIDYDETESIEESEFVARILYELTDYIDLISLVEVPEQVKIGFQLQTKLNELENKGYYLFGERTIEKYQFNNNQTSNWDIAILVLKRKVSDDIYKFDSES